MDLKKYKYRLLYASCILKKLLLLYVLYLHGGRSLRSFLTAGRDADEDSCPL